MKTDLFLCDIPRVITAGIARPIHYLILKLLVHVYPSCGRDSLHQHCRHLYIILILMTTPTTLTQSKWPIMDGMKKTHLVRFLQVLARATEVLRSYSFISGRGVSNIYSPYSINPNYLPPVRFDPAMCYNMCLYFSYLSLSLSLSLSLCLSLSLALCLFLSARLLNSFSPLRYAEKVGMSKCLIEQEHAISAVYMPPLITH